MKARVGSVTSAVILAAGICSRLGAHAAEKPKGLLPLGSSTSLDRQVTMLREAGIQDIGIVVGFCAETVRRHFAGGAVTLIDNPDYASPNSLYSLWLARAFAERGPTGFMVLSSDLVFTPAMLRALIEYSADAAIVVDRETLHAASDMVKVQLDGDRIVHMSKTLDPGLAHAEAVGPVRFSRPGGEHFFEHVRRVIESGQRQQWYFYALSDFAKTNPVHGVQNPGAPWVEIDTPEDLDCARRQVADGVL